MQGSKGRLVTHGGASHESALLFNQARVRAQES
jgi:hypothetical protein